MFLHPGCEDSESVHDGLLRKPRLVLLESLPFELFEYEEYDGVTFDLSSVSIESEYDGLVMSDLVRVSLESVEVTSDRLVPDSSDSVCQDTVAE